MCTDMTNFTPTEYKLVCVANSEIFEDEGWMLNCPTYDKPSLVRAQYAKRQLDVKAEKGLYKYRDWLPVHRSLHCEATQSTYKSEALARALGLQNLYITYLDVMSFSRSGLIQQLVFEGFTQEEAEYGVNAVGY